MNGPDKGLIVVLGSFLGVVISVTLGIFIPEINESMPSATCAGAVSFFAGEIIAFLGAPIIDKYLV